MERTRPPWLIATHDLLPGTGQGHPSYALARRLVALGRPVHVVANRVADELKQARGLAVHPIARPRGSTVLGDLLLNRKARQVIHRLGLDRRTSPIVAMGGNLAIGSINWVHYVHHAWPPTSNPTGSRLARIKHRALHAYERGRERRAIASASVVIANSNRTKADLVEQLGVPTDRVHVVYYGSDASALRPVTPEDRAQGRQVLGLSPSMPVVSFVGAMGRDGRKGFDVLLRAWKIRAEQGRSPIGVLLAAGAGDLDYWGRLVTEAGLGDAVRLLGYRPDIDRILAASDLLVSPTRYEAYGLNVHEALCRGVPALVPRSAGVAERYPSSFQSWLLEDPNDAVELAATIDQTLVEGRPAVAMDRFAEDLKSRSWDDMADEIIRLWDGRPDAA